MNNLSQNDPRWKNLRLGTSNLTYGQAACFVTSLAMLGNTLPTEVNALLLAQSGYVNGCQINSSKAPQILGLEYDGKTTAHQTSMCIAETNYYAPIVNQHFFVWLGDGTIIDPIDGRTKNSYPVVSFRLYKPRITNNEPMALLSDKEIDDQFRLFIDGRATDQDEAFWRTRDVNELVTNLCAKTGSNGLPSERFDLINRIFKSITNNDATDQDQDNFYIYRMSIGEITKTALERAGK